MKTKNLKETSAAIKALRSDLINLYDHIDQLRQKSSLVDLDELIQELFDIISEEITVETFGEAPGTFRISPKAYDQVKEVLIGILYPPDEPASNSSKCDNCRFNSRTCGLVSGSESYCLHGHWRGHSGPSFADMAVNDMDPWDDCSDFEEARGSTSYSVIRPINE